ncbi:unnamed protein product [Phytomonas sp. EM1]|nr:unnamed protein product [Phytomonas sp. EM1]|eukprot:CCW60135.1 unnamed protein product [Phytomonas sp. isolate EM1]
MNNQVKAPGPREAAPPQPLQNGRRVTFKAQQAIDADTVEARLAEVVRVSLYPEHVSQLVLEGGEASWNTVLQDNYRRRERKRE